MQNNNASSLVPELVRMTSVCDCGSSARSVSSTREMAALTLPSAELLDNLLMTGRPVVT